MSFPAQSLSQKKRKRSTTALDELPSSQLPLNSINPLSHSPGTILQFALAGLSETDKDPSLLIPDFPHRSLDRGGAAGRTVESDSENDGSEQEDTDADAMKKKKNKASEQGLRGHFKVLLQSVHQFLDQGEIEKAARAYGLLLQLRPRGTPVDLRHHNLWAIGAEVLMREGEESPHNRENKPETQTTTTRWGRASNMNKVKAYFETIIQQHPYDYKHPRNASALDFSLAMFGCEIYNAHTEHVMALGRLEDAARDWDDEEPSFGSYRSEEEYRGDGVGEREGRLNRRKEELRLQGLAAMRDITRRMDMLMQDLPYSKNQHFLRLRAMAALYVGDLAVPLANASPFTMEEGQRRRHMEHQTARDALKKILENGGELDEVALSILYPGGEDEDEPSVPLYSSLPIRAL